MKSSSTMSGEKCDTTPRFKKNNGKFKPMPIGKVPIATELTRDTKAEEVTLPEKYQEYASEFSEEATNWLPPSWPFDHPIDLDESFIPKVGKVYPLTPKEQKATEDVLKENLKSGKIRPSKSPQASSFFFIGKKDDHNALRPCQDYRYVHSHTIKDTYPLPLVSDLINKVAWVFTKFDVQWGYNCWSGNNVRCIPIKQPNILTRNCIGSLCSNTWCKWYHADWWIGNLQQHCLTNRLINT